MDIPADSIRAKTYSLELQRPRVYPPKYPFMPRTYGEKLRQKRFNMGLLQRDIAKTFQVSEDTIYLWENNYAKPTKSNLKKIINFIGNKVNKIN